jgi:extradiol dioxygenase
MGLGHIVINVNELEKTTSFYRDVLGLRISDYVEINRGDRNFKMSFFHCNPRHHSLALVGRPGTSRISHFMVEVQSLDDVGATYYLCQEKDVPIATTLGRHTNDQMVSFYMLCPSGYRVEYGCEGRLIDDATWAIQHYTTGSIWGHKPAVAPQGAGAAVSSR